MAFGQDGMFPNKPIQIKQNNFFAFSVFDQLDLVTYEEVVRLPAFMRKTLVLLGKSICTIFIGLQSDEIHQLQEKKCPVCTAFVFNTQSLYMYFTVPFWFTEDGRSYKMRRWGFQRWTNRMWMRPGNRQMNLSAHLLPEPGNQDDLEGCELPCQSLPCQSLCVEHWTERLFSDLIRRPFASFFPRFP